jgi:hypothetical protein
MENKMFSLKTKKRAGGVAQCVGSEIKPQYHTHTHTHTHPEEPKKPVTDPQIHY